MDSAEAPAISNMVCDDYSMTATLTAGANTGYYAYAVLPAGVSVDPETVLRNGYSKSAYGYGSFNAAKTPSATIKAEDLDPNVDYVIYAVANSKERGALSKMSELTFKTSDKEDPEYDDCDNEGNVLYLYFTEGVRYDESKEISVRYYARYSKENSIFEDKEMGFATVESVKVDGDEVEITLSGIPDGAYFSASYPEGTFVDAVGNKCAALESGFAATEKGELTGTGALGRIDPVTFDLAVEGSTEEEPVEVEVITAGDEAIALQLPEGVEFGLADDEINGTVEYITSNSKTTYTDFGEAKAGYYYDGDDNLVYVFVNYAEEYTGRPDPVRGSNVSFTVPEGYITDIYGNTSTEFSLGPVLFSYGYDVEDIYGTWNNSGESAFGPTYNEESWSFTVAASDDAKKGNVMITEYYGFETKIYADFDTDMGTLTFDIYNPYLGTVDMGNGMAAEFFTASYGTDEDEPDIVFEMTSVGEITDGSDYPGWYANFYAIPEGGIEEITKDDYLDYGYNFFMPEFTTAALETAIVSPAAASASKPHLTKDKAPRK